MKKPEARKTMASKWQNLRLWIRENDRMEEKSILRVKKLYKSFGGLLATNNITFEMKTGEMSAIIGPNGAGKSTFFNLLTGFYSVDQGTIFFKEKNITNWPPYKIAGLGIARAFQVSNIYPRLTTYENVRQAVLTQQKKTLKFFFPAAKMARRENWELIEITGLKENAQVLAGNLSQGDKKRLELAIALGRKPDLLFLDEPTAGMSREETQETMNLVARLNKEMGLTILFTEHDMAVVFGYARRLTVLNAGTIIAEGTPEEVRANQAAQRIYLGEDV
jgi:branched-chain amino acid transport system ATP-binding protein